MFGNIINNMLGGSSSFNGAYNAQQQAQSAYPQHAGGLIANQMYGAHNQAAMANNAYAQNQAAFHNMAQQMRPKDFRINGVDMDLDQFLDTLYPEDCPERSYLVLKLTKENRND